MQVNFFDPLSKISKKHCISVFFNAGGSFHILFLMSMFSYQNSYSSFYVYIFWIDLINCSFLEAIIYTVKAITNHRGMNKGRWIFICYLKFQKKCCISVGFFCWWVISYIIFDEYVFISKITLIILCLIFFNGFDESVFYFCFFKAIIYIVKMIPDHQGIKNGKWVYFFIFFTN